jgi:hypothetical protein
MTGKPNGRAHRLAEILLTRDSLLYIMLVSGIEQKLFTYFQSRPKGGNEAGIHWAISSCKDITKDEVKFIL